ncbi:MAG: ADP-ribosylglycohydrolase family protein [Gemmatimonadales bacterium]
MRDALAGCLLGQALGDALGLVVEAAPPESAEEYVAGYLLTGHAGERAHPLFEFGQYSDDTQLARELLLSMRDAHGWDPAVFAGRIALLFSEGRDVGAGAGTRAAAARLQAGVPWSEAGTPPPYAGNGSAMRAAPVGVIFHDDVPRLLHVATEQSMLTHTDTRCRAGAIAVAGAAALAASREPIVAGEFLDRLAAWAGHEDHAMGRAIRLIGGWLDLPPEIAAHRLHKSGLDSARMGPWRGIPGHVVPSVAWSLYSFLRTPDDYWATVCTAIGVGGDTDTMAAMAGAISGARLGAGALPAALLTRLTDRGAWGAADLTELSDDCARIFHSPASPS